MSGGGLVCSFGRSDVYEGDLETLAPGQWLNDAVINFCCDRMSLVEFEGRGVAFVHPGVSFVLSFEDDEDDFRDTLEGAGVTAAACRLALFPINDKQVTGRPGGAHWSLLAVDRDAGRFLHFDSAGGANDGVARNLAGRLSPHVGCAMPVARAQCPQQTNSFDCGVYAVTFARELARSWAEGNGPASEAAADRLRRTVSPATVTGMRATIEEWARALKQ